MAESSSEISSLIQPHIKAWIRGMEEKFEELEKKSRPEFIDLRWLLFWKEEIEPAIDSMRAFFQESVVNNRSNGDMQQHLNPEATEALDENLSEYFTEHRGKIRLFLKTVITIIRNINPAIFRELDDLFLINNFFSDKDVEEREADDIQETIRLSLILNNASFNGQQNPHPQIERNVT